MPFHRGCHERRHSHLTNLCNFLLRGPRFQRKRERVYVQREAVRLIVDEALALLFFAQSEGKLEFSDQHCEDHTQLYHRQWFASAIVSAVRERNKDIFTQNELRLGGPTLGNKVIWPDECTGVYECQLSF